jgi:hypothetical protein
MRLTEPICQVRSGNATFFFTLKILLDVVLVLVIGKLKFEGEEENEDDYDVQTTRRP